MKKLKGNVTIKLFDKDGKLVHEESKDNMITNAIYYALGQCITNYGTPTDNNEIFPLATQALGGVFLFDGELEEDVDNVLFPCNVHLIGHAGQSQNTNDTLRGSLNVSESGRTDTGYVNTWDFSTSQANGNIKSVALTHKQGGDFPMMWWNDGDWTNITNSSSGGAYIFEHNNKTQTAFGYYGNNIYSFHTPSYDLLVSDPRHPRTRDVVLSTLIETVNTGDRRGDEQYDWRNFTFSYNHAGYLYAITVNRQENSGYYPYWRYGFDNAEGDAEIWVRKWRYIEEEGTFEEVPYSPTESRYYYKLTNVHAKGYNPSEPDNRWAVVNENWLWIVHQDNMHVYRINMDNMAEVYLYGPFDNHTIGGLIRYVEVEL